MNKGYIFLGVGFELVSLVLAAVWLGGRIDAYMEWKGYSTLGLILAMLFGWFVHLFVLLKRFEEDEAAEQNSAASPPEPAARPWRNDDDYKF